MSQFAGTVIAEPTGSAVVSAERGALWVKIHSAGVTAHGSVPETGVNAIQYLIETLEKIRKGFNPQSVHPTLGKTTMKEKEREIPFTSIRDVIYTPATVSRMARQFRVSSRSGVAQAAGSWGIRLWKAVTAQLERPTASS